jgi:hypothetical protein
MATTQPILIALGESLELDATITLAGAGVIAGATVHFTVKASLNDADAAALIRKDTGAGIAVVDSAAGKVRIALLPADTAALPVGVVLPFDIKLQPSDSTKAHIVYEGQLQTRRPVTRRSAAI